MSEVHEGTLRRFCGSCGRQTQVQRLRTPIGRVDVCPGCHFPYDFASIGADRAAADAHVAACLQEAIEDVREVVCR